MKSLIKQLFQDLNFLNDLQEGIWIANNRDQIVFVNRPLLRLLGYDNEEKLIGGKWHDLFPPAELPRLTRKPSTHYFIRMLNDTAIITNDGRMIPAAVILTRKTVNNSSWYIGSVTQTVATGITEWISRQVMENAAEGICIVENKQLIYVNRRLEQLSGYTAPQLLRMGLERLLHPADRRIVTPIINEPAHYLAPVQYDVKIQHRSGQEIECELRIIPIEQPTRYHLLCYLRDLSELKQAKQLGTDFVAMVSHDLRTPLAAIKEAFSLLAETAASKLDEKQRRYLQIAREEINRLNWMISNLIEVSSIEAGKMVLNLRAVDLPQLLNTSLESLSLLLTKKNLKIERRIRSKLPPAVGDADRLLEVFTNLLDNAIKYSPESGTIRVEMEMIDPEAPILSEPGILTNTPYVKVTISDEGPGIPAEFLDRIFGKFERVEPYGSGTGLGLAIVRSIIELHHGKVWAHSKFGEGANFSFILPVKEEL